MEVERVDVGSASEYRWAFKGRNKNIPGRTPADRYATKGDEPPCVSSTEIRANRTASSGVGRGSCMVLRR